MTSPAVKAPPLGAHVAVTLRTHTNGRRATYRGVVSKQFMDTVLVLFHPPVRVLTTEYCPSVDWLWVPLTNVLDWWEERPGDLS